MHMCAHKFTYYKSRGDCIAMSLREGIWVEADCGENLRTFCRGMPLGGEYYSNLFCIELNYNKTYFASY